MNTTWKANWEESKRHYLDWWNGSGLVVSMWDIMPKEGAPHADTPPRETPKDSMQKWLDPDWRARDIHRQMARGCFLADIPPAAQTHLGPGSLAAILGCPVGAGDDTIWFRPAAQLKEDADIIYDPESPGMRLHRDLLRSCKQHAQGSYFVGMPDLAEGLDILAAMFGADNVMINMIEEPELIERQLQQINDIYFTVFDELYDIIREGREMAFCYFSLWAPGKTAKLQCDISAMFGEAEFRRFAQPLFREQCQKIDYTLYHLDGVDAVRHLDALLEIDELNAIQWTPGVQEAQGGNPKWYDLYRRIRAAGKSVMASWVQVDEIEPLLDAVGGTGMLLLVDFKNERDIERALTIAEKYR